MKRNMGFLDRTVRTLIAVSIIGISYTGIISGTLAVILFIVSAIFLLTSIFGYCPLYSLLNINTCQRMKQQINRRN